MEKKLTALIVDDDEPAVRWLEHLLDETHFFSEIRRATSLELAVPEVLRFQYDLVFVEIDLKGGGSTLLKSSWLEGLPSAIVVVSSNDSYALDAIRHHAMGYLVKPVKRPDLDECLEYFVRQRASLPRAPADANPEPGRLRFNTKTGYFFVDPSSIIYCQADGNYCRIQTGEKLHVCTLQLGKVQELLPPDGFGRLGRSLIVNFKYISSVDRKKNLLHFERSSHSCILKVTDSQLKELNKQPR